MNINSFYPTTAANEPATRIFCNRRFRKSFFNASIFFLLFCCTISSYANVVSSLSVSPLCAISNGKGGWTVNFLVNHSADKFSLCSAGGAVDISFSNGINFEFSKDGIHHKTLRGYGTGSLQPQSLDFTNTTPDELHAAFNQANYSFNQAPGTTSAWTVTVRYTYGNCNGGVAGNIESTTNVVYITTPASVPNILSATNITCNSFRANCYATSPADKFFIDVSTDPNFSPGTFVYQNVQMISNYPNPYYDVTGLTTGVTYYYRVRAWIQNCLYTDYSGKTDVIPENLPAPTSSTVFQHHNCNSVNIDWSDVPGATGYYIEVATDPSFMVLLNPGNTEASGSLKTIPGLTVGNTYYYRIATRNAPGCKGTYHFGIFDLEIPPAPLDIDVTPSCTSAIITLNSSRTSFRVKVSNDNFSTVLFEQDFDNILMYPIQLPIAGLSPGTTYQVSIASNEDGCLGAYSAPFSFGTLFILPPSNPSAPSYTCHSFTALWDDVAGSTGYIMDISTDPSFSTFESRVITGRTYEEVTGLLHHTDYYYRVRSFNAQCTSVYSAVTHIHTPDLITGNATPVSVTCKGALLNWLDIPAASDAIISVWKNELVPEYVIQDYSIIYAAESFAIPGTLTPNTTYYFSFTPTPCGRTQQGSFTTEPLLDAPVPADADLITCKSFRANWNTVTGATGYYISVYSDAALTTPVTGFEYYYVAGGSASSVVVTGLIPGHTYYYRTSSANECISDVSTVKPATTLALPEINLTTQNGCFTSKFSWITVPGVTEYSLTINNSNTWIGPQAKQYTVTGLSASTTYHYVLEVTMSPNDCSIILEGDITTQSDAPTANAGIDKITCGSDPVTLSANDPGNATGTWSIISGTGGSFSNVNNPNAVFTPVYGNVYTLRWTVSTSCGSVYDEVTIYANAITYTNGNEAYLTERCHSFRPICVNGLGYSWNGKLYSRNGTHALLPLLNFSGDYQLNQLRGYNGNNISQGNVAVFGWDEIPTATGPAYYDQVNLFITGPGMLGSGNSIPKILDASSNGTTYDIYANPFYGRPTGTYSVTSPQIVNPGNIDNGTVDDYFLEQNTSNSYCTNVLGNNWRLPTKTEMGATEDLSNSTGMNIDPGYYRPTGPVNNSTPILTSSLHYTSAPVMLWAFRKIYNSQLMEAIPVYMNTTDAVFFSCVFQSSGDCPSGNRTINEPTYNYGDVTTQSDDLGLKGSAMKQKQITREVAAEIKVAFMPNPTSGDAVFKCSSNESFHYELIDMQGRTLQQGDIVTGDKISLESCNTGIYMVRILTTQGTYVTSTKLLKK